MRFKPIIFFASVGLIAGLLLYRQVTHRNQPATIEIGAQAPDFAIKDASGKLVKLSDFRGNIVLVNFWATWCKPCVEELPELSRMNRAFEGRKFRMMAVSIDNDWEIVQSFYQKLGVDIPTYLDPGHQVSDLYKVFKFPETFILDENGSVLKHFWFPPQGWPAMMSSLDDLLKKQETADRAAQ